MKKTNIIKYAFLALAVLSFSSCDDWLNNKPKGFTIPEKYEDYVQLINNQGLIIGYHNYPVYFTDDLQLLASGTLEDCSSFDFASQDQYYQRIYSFEHGQVFTPGESDPIWEGCYSNIFTYNAIINNVLSSSGGNDTDKKNVWAQALVGRAYEYLTLVNLYATHYNKETAETDYGVPLVLSEELTGEKYARATVADVYRQIEEDLTKAAPSLKEKAPNIYMPAQPAGYAFLARMYLYMGEYQKALDNANISLEKNNTLLDLTEYTTKSGTWGRIIKADGSDEEFPSLNNPEYIFARYCSHDMYLKAAVSDDLLATFKENLPEEGEDMRFRLFYSVDRFDSKKGEEFPGYTSYAPYIYTNLGFSIPETYLIAAECEARVGNVNTALKHLNDLRDMRIKNNVHFETPTTLSREEVLKLVINERRKEFAYIGMFRLIDLKRLNREAWFAKTITHSAGSEGTWTLEPNDLRYIMPVPENVLSFNPDMPQYER